MIYILLHIYFLYWKYRWMKPNIGFSLFWCDYFFLKEELGTFFFQCKTMFLDRNFLPFLLKFKNLLLKKRLWVYLVQYVSWTNAFCCPCIHAWTWLSSSICHVLYNIPKRESIVVILIWNHQICTNSTCFTNECVTKCSCVVGGFHFLSQHRFFSLPGG